jgi:hypothetical protein
LKNIGIVAIAALVALVLGFGASVSTQPAEASATDIQLIVVSCLPPALTAT